MPGPRSAKNRRAIVIGGSMSGLFSAAFLRQVGWDCDVYERSGVELVGRGAGITTHPELLEALEKSGAGTRDLGIELPKRIAIDRLGKSSPPGTACNGCSAPPSIPHIIISVGRSSASSRAAAACAFISTAVVSRMPTS